MSRVFRTPILVGTVLVYAFYTLMMYGNGDPAGINALEGAGMLACLAVVGVVSVLLYLVYRLTLRKKCVRLPLTGPGRERPHPSRDV